MPPNSIAGCWKTPLLVRSSSKPPALARSPLGLSSGGTGRESIEIEVEEVPWPMRRHLVLADVKGSETLHCNPGSGGPVAAARATDGKQTPKRLLYPETQTLPPAETLATKAG